jgi:NAD(P)-dependent dehydrogenase (short-subunit alcohol dehydrogenase family)
MADMEVGARTALVTGSSRGIGRDRAEARGMRRPRIGVHYQKNAEAAEKTARLLRERGAEAVAIQADVTRPEDIARMFAEAGVAKLDPLGIFVANARPDVEHFCRPVFDLAPEHWRAALDPQATTLRLSARGSLASADTVGQPNSKLVTPKMRSARIGGGGRVYIRAVSKTGDMPASRASATAAAFGSGTSRKSGPAGAAPARDANKAAAASAPSAKSGPILAPRRQGRTTP